MAEEKQTWSNEAGTGPTKNLALEDKPFDITLKDAHSWKIEEVQLRKDIALIKNNLKVDFRRFL